MVHLKPLRVSRIRVYPLKSGAGFDLADTRVNELGIPGDRRWMLVRPDGLFLSQRTHPRLALIRSEPVSSGRGEGMAFRLTAPGVGSLILETSARGPREEVRVQKDLTAAILGPAEADEWFSRFLGDPCRLAFIPDDVERPVDRKYAPGHRVSLADGYPIHLTSEESLNRLNRRLDRKVTMWRFRPNLVVEGGRPWDEDEWRVLRIGDVVLQVVKPCARCVITAVHPGTGTRVREPLRTLKRFRKQEGKVYFGQNAVVLEGGRFRLGSDVHIVERGEARPHFDLNQGSVSSAR